MSSRSEPGSESLHPDIREVTWLLLNALGGTLVATLAGANDPKAPYEWAGAGGPRPATPAVERLRCAHEQWQAVSDAEGDPAARAWFVSANPWLGDETSANAIRHG